MPRYESREPSQEPELLSMDYDSDGHGSTQAVMLCAYPECGAVAVYEATYSDSTFAYWCEKHGDEEASREGLDRIDGGDAE